MSPQSQTEQEKASVGPAVAAVSFLVFCLVVALVMDHKAPGLMLWTGVFVTSLTTTGITAALIGVSERRLASRAPRVHRIVTVSLGLIVAVAVLGIVVGFIVMVWKFGQLIAPVIAGG